MSSKGVIKKLHIRGTSGNVQTDVDNASSVSGSGTSISGDIQSGAGSVVFGHNANFTTASDEPNLFDEEVLIDAQAAMYTFRLKSGKYWKYPGKNENPNGPITVELIDVIQKSGKWYAYTKIDTGGGLLAGGKQIEQVETNTFMIPATDYQLDRDELCAYSLYFSPQPNSRHFSFTVIRVDHIDRHDKIATFAICHVRGHA